MTEQQKRWYAIIALAVLLAAISFYTTWQKSQALPVAVAPAAAAAEKTGNKATEVVVYVSGAVLKPGVVTLPAGARVIDAVKAAGGGTAEADMERINLAQAVKDGMQIQIPRVAAGNAANAGGAAGRPAASEAHLVNINTADKAMLDSLPGIGPALAERIVEYREKHGPFQDIADLKKVSGIGESKWEKLKDKVTL